jgi:hypothetical protein
MKHGVRLVLEVELILLGVGLHLELPRPTALSDIQIAGKPRSERLMEPGKEEAPTGGHGAS